MHAEKDSKRATDGSYTIHSIIKTLNDVSRVIQLKDRSQEIHVLARSISAPPQHHLNLVKRIFKIQDVLGQLKSNLQDVKRLQFDVKIELDKQLGLLLKVTEDADSTGTLNMSSTGKTLDSIIWKLVDLMRKVPVLPKRLKNKRASPHYQHLPSIYVNEEDFKKLTVFRYVQGAFEELREEWKICLLSFAIFPENQEVNRTMLMYWWIGEGILPVIGAEDAVKDILKDLTGRKLIEPVVNTRKVEPSSYKMTPIVHTSVVIISKEIGLFNMYQKDEKPSMHKSELKKVCLVEGSISQPEAKTRNMVPKDIETVFNVSERYPDFIFRWFSSMKKIKVLYLGRWERTEREIEMDSYEIMNDFSPMKNLRFLSFQGISTIRILYPSVCKLDKLVILDLRGCYNLEQLAREIDSLKSLVYLDLTGCDTLECMPKRLSWLDNLEVLKGFVVNLNLDEEQYCQLTELTHLKKLRKLSVVVAGEYFGFDELLKAIIKIKRLEKLKVRWRNVNPKSKKQQDYGVQGIFKRSKSLLSGNMYSEPEVSLPSTLKKLDLQRFPDSKLPKWLEPQKLTHLEKLYLGSSRHFKAFSDSLSRLPSECNVQVLRLKCLQKLKVDWIELTELYFPKLSFLEIYECPRVILCPCDRDGIWRADEDD